MVYITVSLRPNSPFHPRQALAGPIFLTSGIPFRPPGRIFDGGFPDFRWTHSDRKSHLELKAASLALHHWVKVLRSLQVLTATDNTTVVSVYPQTGRDPLQRPVTSSCCFILWLQSHLLRSISQ